MAALTWWGKLKGKRDYFSKSSGNDNSEHALKNLFINFSSVMANNSEKSHSSSPERKPENQLRTCYDKEVLRR